MMSEEVLQNVAEVVRQLPDSIILRNHDMVANLRRGGDIDLIVADVAAAESALIERLGPPRFVARRSYVTGIYYDWGYIDLLPNCQWRGAVYLSRALLSRDASTGSPGARTTRLAHESVSCWFSSLLWGGFFKERYHQIVCRSAIEDRAEFQQVLTDATGISWGERLLEMATNGTPEQSVKVASSIRWAVVTRALRRQPLQTIRGFLAFWLAEIHLRLSPPLPWVAFLGPDGSGKSTLLREVAVTIGVAQTHCYHWRPRVLNWRAESDLPVTAPHARPPRGTLVSLLKMAALILDWWIGYSRVIVQRRARQGLVLFDRHFVDLLVDPKRYRFGAPIWIARLAARVVPQPDLFILLDAPAEMLQARKSEVDLQEGLRQREHYLRLAEYLPNAFVIDVTRPVEVVVAEVRNVILDFMTNRTARRCGPTAHTRVATSG